MKKGRFTEGQIVSILKEADAGTKVKDICRRLLRASSRSLMSSARKRLSDRFCLKPVIFVFTPPKDLRSDQAPTLCCL